MPVRSTESRRVHSLLGQRRVADVVMVIILSVAFLAGLVGFAIHVVWVVAIVVLALGLAPSAIVGHSRVRRTTASR